MRKLKEFLKKDIMKCKLSMAEDNFLDDCIDADSLLLDFELKLPLLNMYEFKEIDEGMASRVVIDNSITVGSLLGTTFMAELLLIMACKYAGVSLSDSMGYFLLALIIGMLLLKDIVVNVIENMQRYEKM